MDEVRTKCRAGGASVKVGGGRGLPNAREARVCMGGVWRYPLPEKFEI